MGSENKNFGFGMAKNWLKEKIFEIITIIIVLATAFYNLATSTASTTQKITEVEKKIDELTKLLSKTVDILNQHLIWSEGKSVMLIELSKKVDKLEERLDKMNPKQP